MNNKIEIKIKDGVTIPKYETELSAGMDVRAFIDAPVEISPGGVALIPTGISVALPRGMELQVRPRSGLALKKSVTVLNAPGTVDADYRGDVGVILINHSNESFVVEPGDRVAQLVFAKYEEVSFSVVDELSSTERGEGGFGSSGVK